VLEPLRLLQAYPGQRVLEQPRGLGVMGVDVVVVVVVVGDAEDLGLEVDVAVDVAVDVVLVVEEVVLVLAVLVVVVVVEEEEEVVVVVVVVVEDGGADADAFSPLPLPPVLLDRLGGLVDNLVPCVKPLYNDVYGCYYKIKNNWPKDGKLLM